MITVDQDKLAAINSAKLFALAEAHIASHFTTARLLQMKDWRDTFPEDDAPMLEAVYDWLNGITIQAAQGQTNFAEPPYTFDELLVEAVRFLVP